MRSPRQQRELLKEVLREPAAPRTFATLFPWRNAVRAVMLLLVIVGIVALKRSAGSLLAHIGNLWEPTPTTAGVERRRVRPPRTHDFKVHLGPGLVPAAPSTGAPVAPPP